MSKFDIGDRKYKGTSFEFPKEYVDAELKKHKEADPLDHPDKSVKTDKLDDGAVTDVKIGSRVINNITKTLTGWLQWLVDSINTLSNSFNYHKTALTIDHPDKSVKTDKLDDEAVTDVKIGNRVINNITKMLTGWLQWLVDSINTLSSSFNYHKTALTMDHPDKSVKTDKLDDGAVTEVKIQNDAVSDDKIGQRVISGSAKKLTEWLQWLVDGFNTHKSASTMDHPSKSVKWGHLDDHIISREKMTENSVDDDVLGTRTLQDPNDQPVAKNLTGWLQWLHDKTYQIITGAFPVGNSEKLNGQEASYYATADRAMQYRDILPVPKNAIYLYSELAALDDGIYQVPHAWLSRLGLPTDRGYYEGHLIKHQDQAPAIVNLTYVDSKGVFARHNFFAGYEHQMEPDDWHDIRSYPVDSAKNYEPSGKIDDALNAIKNRVSLVEYTGSYEKAVDDGFAGTEQEFNALQDNLLFFGNPILLNERQVYPSMLFNMVDGYPVASENGEGDFILTADKNGDLHVKCIDGFIDEGTGKHYKFIVENETLNIREVI